MAMVIDRRVVLLGAAMLACGRASGGPLADLVTSIKRSVFAVGTFNALDAPRFGFRGTGFAVADGSLIVTCWHVLPDLSALGRPGITSLAVQVTQVDGSTEVREANLLVSERQHDLAVLKLKGPPLPALTLSRAGAAREGMDVALVGFPIGGALGFKHVTHRGIVASIVASALPSSNSRQLNEGAASRLRQGSFELLQLDATAYPGNSGGPLVDVETGHVLGVINMVLIKGNRESALSQPTGITYAVPVRYLTELLSKA